MGGLQIMFQNWVSIIFVGVRAQQFSRRLSDKLHPRRVLQDTERNQSRNMGAPQPHISPHSQYTVTKRIYFEPFLVRHGHG